MSLLEPLDADEVHVWLARPDSIVDPALLSAYDALMSDAERTKQRRFAFEKGRRECLITRALVRTALSKYAAVAPQAWAFVQGERGKPSIAPDLCELPLSFNLSHTDGLIACAVSLNRDLGVDVEWLNRRGDTVSIADGFFSPFEVQALHALPADRQRERFFQYWTLKESYIKARGMGLALPLDQFSFHLDESASIRISFDPRLKDDAKHWQFQLERPSPEHMLALGVRRGANADLRVTIRDTVPLAGPR